MIRKYKEWQPKIHSETYVDPTAVITGNVSISQQVGVYAYATLRGDDEVIKIGSNTNIQEHVVIHVSKSHKTTIGEGVSIGHGAILHGCDIHNHVLIGMHATVLDGAVIGEHSIVAAGSLCPPNKIYPPNSMIMGSPAKVVRELTEVERSHIITNAAHYVMLSNEYKKQSL